MPAADRSWAIPTRPECPVMSRQPGSPAARAACCRRRRMVSVWRLKTGVTASITAYSGRMASRASTAARSQVQHHPLGLLVGLRLRNPDAAAAVSGQLHVPPAQGGGLGDPQQPVAHDGGQGDVDQAAAPGVFRRPGMTAPGAAAGESGGPDRRQGLGVEGRRLSLGPP